MSDDGHLCYSRGSLHSLVYKRNKSNPPLVYRAANKLTTVTFAWGSDGKDLDICAYWNGAPEMKMGYGWNTSTAEQITEQYHITYSGDEQGTNASEWCKIKMNPWNEGQRTFEVHFNFYGYDSDDYPANRCTVIASQVNGTTKILRDVNCSTRRHEKAETSDPGVVVSFDTDGNLSDLYTTY